jgi:serine/threonine-protein kinase
MLASGTRVGVYEVVAPIGAGGMGEVFRARDTKLGRDVALKVLPHTLASDPERVARMHREAQVLAALNHPNIAAIYGFEDRGEIHALVLEFVDGETLADRIARGPIPLGDALPIAKQIAEALEAAHEQGIIHRDLKPANIKVRRDGTVKVLDFGLAKLAESSPNTPSGPNALSMSPTITSPALATGLGVLLGTAAYMSPEQAKGRPADKRSDIWGFGCVLYEMLTGKRCFDAEDVADTLAFVLTKQPDWHALPPTTPPVIGTLLRRCLEKDRRKRIGGIDAAIFAIDEVETASATGVRASSVTVVARPVSLWRRLAIYSVPALIAGAAIAGEALWFATRPTPSRVVQLTIATTAATAVTIDGADRDLTITPDGSSVVYAGNHGTELFARSLDALEPVSLYAGAPRAPFVSPDGQWVGFVNSAVTLNKVPINGGPPVTLTTLDGASRGAVWLPDNTIVFATSSGTGLQQVAATGGPATVLTHPDRTRGEAGHVWPEALPGGRALLFTIAPTTGRVDAAQIAVLDLQTHIQTVVVRGGSHAHYVASGHLVYAAGGTLRAIAFDPTTLTTRGTPVPVVAEVVTTGGAPAGGVDAVVADDGTLAYVRGIGAGPPLRPFVWIDRQGRETAIAAPPHAYAYLQLSPDGGRVAVYTADQGNDLWVWDLARLTLTRLTSTPGVESFPVWTPDGRRVLFGADRERVRICSRRPPTGPAPRRG